MQIAVSGIDLGKNGCNVVGLDSTEAVVKRRRMRPEGVAAFAEDLPNCLVAMEACCGAHHLGRLLLRQGHQVRLMSPEYVRVRCCSSAESRSHKGDANLSGTWH
jgi:transposase